MVSPTRLGHLLKQRRARMSSLELRECGCAPRGPVCLGGCVSLIPQALAPRGAFISQSGQMPGHTCSSPPPHHCQRKCQPAALAGRPDTAGTGTEHWHGPSLPPPPKPGPDQHPTWLIPDPSMNARSTRLYSLLCLPKGEPRTNPRAVGSQAG